MRVDFYLLSSDPAPAAIALLASKVRQAGERLLVVADDLEMLETISQTLWESSPESFLANGIAGDEHDAVQPILLSDEVEPANGAQFLLIADGRWREPSEAFTRVLYLFDQQTIDGARLTWKALQDREGMERRFWKQQDGRWVEGP
ncbi:DNA polymerase III subunit chi [Aurantiacibacter poecillastricola]|uniref:DNA polymerase III subunit chi n=1 Tax=Aurantiacibacter poecillastricola TaxID=3064385 RepID=UPI00273FB66E|nr:DNA polymerase III subunit chi [Aurantiacibacter sp. 219JJ12-13]MDP5262467.1 DNA polymerase III subunit chi [Aurantiacibacter sp. 219JJ12-13]